MDNKINITVCLGSSCSGRDNRDVLSVIQKYIESNNLSDRVNLATDYCFGECSKSPIVLINKQIYTEITPKSAINIIEGYLSVQKH